MDSLTVGFPSEFGGQGIGDIAFPQEDPTAVVAFGPEVRLARRDLNRPIGVEPCCFFDELLFKS